MLQLPCKEKIPTLRELVNEVEMKQIEAGLSQAPIPRFSGPVKGEDSRNRSLYECGL